MKHFQIMILPFLLVVSLQITSTSYKMIVFEGSDWCPNCIQFEKNVLQDSSFIQFADEHKISIERIDFPQRKRLEKAVVKYNEKIADQYHFDGTFPTILLVDESGKVIRLSYENQNRDQFILLLSSKLSQLE